MTSTHSSVVVSHTSRAVIVMSPDAVSVHLFDVMSADVMSPDAMSVHLFVVTSDAVMDGNRDAVMSAVLIR
jgi:hypothetical protein